MRQVMLLSIVVTALAASGAVVAEKRRTEVEYRPTLDNATMVSTIMAAVEAASNTVEAAVEAITPEPATINVTCPASATVTVDDNPTKQTGVKRLFFTPPLAHPGHYTLRAFCCTQAGCYTETKKVHVSPGETVDVTLLAQVQARHECPCGTSCSCSAGQCGHPACPTVGYSAPQFAPPMMMGGCAGGCCGGGGCAGGRCR